MKKLTYFLFATLAMLAIASCQNSKAPKDASTTQGFQGTLAETDTTDMLKLADDCMALLQASKLDEALDMLYEYDDSTHSVTPLSEETRSAYKKKFTMFPVVKYTRAYYSFNAEGCNDVKYNVSFGEDFDGQSPKTAFMFNPVKIDGQWYLSVKRSDQSLDELNR